MKIQAVSDIRDEIGCLVYDNTISKSELFEKIAYIVKNELSKGIPDNEICIIAPQWWLLFPLSKKMKELLPDVKFDAPDITPIKYDPMNLFYLISKLLFTESGQRIKLRKRVANEIIEILTEEYKICLSEKIDSYKVLKVINSISLTDENGIVYLEKAITKFLMGIGIDLSIETYLNKAYEDFITKDRETKEVEAESIAYTVCQHFGIYTQFNIDHPADFTGHSLSVSDVVVLHQDGENTSHYVDSVGYREIPEFTKELSVSAEVTAEKAAVMEEAAENTAVEPDNDKVSYYVIEDLSTWAENSPEKSKLERFDSLPEAVAKFAEYRGKDMEDKPDMVRATFGFNVNGSEFDLIHVRNHENCLSLDFTHSRAAGESSRFMDDLQILSDEVGFDKVRVYREMSLEEIKDFVKQRFEHQLKGSGLDDISLYMGRFDTLYGQGKMEHLMPTANQKRIVEDVPFMEWENPYIDTSVRETDRTETELAFRLADRYISIQEASEGYDYTIYDMDYRELDGGVYDNPDITIRQALDEIVTDLKEPTHRSELEGSKKKKVYISGYRIIKEKIQTSI